MVLLNLHDNNNIYDNYYGIVCSSKYMPNIFFVNIFFFYLNKEKLSTKSWPSQTALWPLRAVTLLLINAGLHNELHTAPSVGKDHAFKHSNVDISVLILLPPFSKRVLSSPQWSPRSRGATPTAPHRRAKTSCSSANPAKAPVRSSTAGRRPATANCCPPHRWWVSAPTSLTLPLRHSMTSPCITCVPRLCRRLCERHHHGEERLGQRVGDVPLRRQQPGRSRGLHPAAQSHASYVAPPPRKHVIVLNLFPELTAWSTIIQLGRGSGVRLVGCGFDPGSN